MKINTIKLKNPIQPKTKTQPILEQQREILRIMAATIGSTISKGFEMPKREYMTFDGNPLTYSSFIENLKTNAEGTESNPNARRSFLIQLCIGKAKEAISGTVMLPPEEGYNKAKSILHEMFGQTHIIAASHVEKVTKGGIIKENEGEKLMQLARDMENGGMNLKSLGYQADINSRSNISAVVLHLPKYLHSEWAKEVQNMRDQGKEPDFSLLTKFVAKKAKLANTEYGCLVNVKPESEKEKGKKPWFCSSSRNNVSAYASSWSIKDGQENQHRSHATTGKPATKSKCPFCDKDGHILKRCFKFREKSHKECKNFIAKKGLHNLCLSKEHFANRCRRNNRCFISGCGKHHHPMLHPVESNKERKQDMLAESNRDERQERPSRPRTQTQHAQVGHCGAVGTGKKQVCLRVILS